MDKEICIVVKKYCGEFVSRNGTISEYVFNKDLEKYQIKSDEEFYKFINFKSNADFYFSCTDKYVVIFDLKGNISSVYNLGPAAVKLLDFNFNSPISYDELNTCVERSLMIPKEFSNYMFAELISVNINSTNHYQFMMNPAVLELILRAYNMDAKGIPYGKEFQIKTGKGAHKKIRDIFAPDESLKPALRRINQVLCRIYNKKNNNVQVAYKTGKSIFDNAYPHQNHKYVFKIDIHDFFPSCTRELVSNRISILFNNTPNNHDAIEKFLDVITYNGGLAIGCPTSGVLANTVLSPMITYMKNICNKYDIALTVYADDITLSSDKFLNKKFVENMFYLAASKHNLTNFQLKEEKSHGLSGTRREVTGVIINNENKLSCKRSMYDNIRLCLHELSHDITEYTESKSLLDYELANKLITKKEYNERLGKKVSINMNKLRGRLAFMHMVDNSGKYERLVKKYKDTIKKYKLIGENTLKKYE